MKLLSAAAHITLLCVVVLAPARIVSAQTMKPEMLAQFEQKTGLTPVEIPDTQGTYLGKTHRGYRVVFTAKAGNVWGRYAARLTAAEIGREVGGFAAHITGQRGTNREGIVGSPLDRLMSRYLGEPVMLAVFLSHEKPHAPRLDVLSDRARLKPEDMLQRRDKVGGNAGYIYAEDAEFASRIAGNAPLMKRLKNLAYQYIRVDQDSVALFFAGTEVEYSGLIRNHGDYFKMLNDLMDDVSDIANAIPDSR
jgi:hypothetical protein